jgi:hypothetical protein
MPDWKTYIGQIPWTAPHKNKAQYNEGDHLSSVPAGGGSPIWRMTRTKTPISLNHIPCGYWTKNYNPDDALSTFTVESISGGYTFTFNRPITSASISPSPGLGTLTKINDTMYQYLWAVGDCMFDTDTIEFEVDDGGVVVTYQYPYEYTGGTGCCGESIGYTTQSMVPLEEQELTVQDGWEDREYAWEITSGGGTLSAESGMSVTYTAPSSNADCTNNPTIVLSVDGETCDTLQIAINEYTGDDKAYVTTYEPGSVVGDCNHAVWAARYKCTGVNFGVNFGCDSCDCSGGSGDCDCGGGFYCLHPNLISRCNSAHACGWDVVDGVNVYTDCGFVATDVRPAALKLAGCCPEALL